VYLGLCGLASIAVCLGYFVGCFIEFICGLGIKYIVNNIKFRKPKAFVLKTAKLSTKPKGFVLKPAKLSKKRSILNIPVVDHLRNVQVFMNQDTVFRAEAQIQLALTNITHNMDIIRGILANIRTLYHTNRQYTLRFNPFLDNNDIIGLVSTNANLFFNASIHTTGQFSVQQATEIQNRIDQINVLQNQVRALYFHIQSDANLVRRASFALAPGQRLTYLNALANLGNDLNNLLLSVLQ